MPAFNLTHRERGSTMLAQTKIITAANQEDHIIIIVGGTLQ
jgi:hypothetical protein